MAIIYKGLILFFTGGTSCLALSFIKKQPGQAWKPYTTAG